MSRRSRDWNEGLASEMKDMEFARQFIISSIEDEGLSLQEVLGKAIRLYGVRDFSELSGIPDSNILRSIDTEHNPTLKTLDELLSPFGLRISATGGAA